MKKETLETLIEKKLSIRKISKELSVSAGCIRYWLNVYNLKTKPSFFREQNSCSIFWKKEKLQKIIKFSFSKAAVIRKLGLTISSSSYRTLEKYIDIFKLDISHFNPYKGRITAKIELKDMLTSNNKISRNTLKRRLLKENLKKNECEVCGFNGNWQNKPIIMILDHINGIKNDNRLENLRMVCPMCNSQLKTYAGRNNLNKKKNKIYYCIDCKKQITKKSKRCLKCSNKARIGRNRKVERPSYKQLIKEIKKTNYVQVGKKYGVCDNTIRKWVKNYSERAISPLADIQ